MNSHNVNTVCLLIRNRDDDERSIETCLKLKKCHFIVSFCLPYPNYLILPLILQPSNTPVPVEPVVPEKKPVRVLSYK